MSFLSDNDIKHGKYYIKTLEYEETLTLLENNTR